MCNSSVNATEILKLKTELDTLKASETKSADVATLQQRLVNAQVNLSRSMGSTEALMEACENQKLSSPR